MLLAVFLLLGELPAQANTYLFGFTGGQLMNALEASQGTAVFNESAYFAILVQPNPAEIGNYSYVGETSPNAAGPNPWESNTITDPSNPNLGYSTATPCQVDCTWALFDKAPGQSSVTVLSGADGGPGGANIFVNSYWWSFGSYPYGWGSFGIITGVMPDDALFSFTIDTPSTLSGSYALQGFASSIQSGSPLSRTFDTKETAGIPFTLNVTPHLESPLATPEPGTLGLLLAGGLTLIAARRRRTGKALTAARHKEQ